VPESYQLIAPYCYTWLSLSSRPLFVLVEISWSSFEQFVKPQAPLLRQSATRHMLVKTKQHQAAMSTASTMINVNSHCRTACAKSTRRCKRKFDLSLSLHKFYMYFRWSSWRNACIVCLLPFEHMMFQNNVTNPFWLIAHPPQGSFVWWRLTSWRAKKSSKNLKKSP